MSGKGRTIHWKMSKYNLVRDELTLSASDNEVAPELPIWFQTKIKLLSKQHRSLSMSNINSVRDELTIKASDNEVIPESPIWFLIKRENSYFNDTNNCLWQEENKTDKYKIASDELTFSVSDNENAPDSPIQL